MKGKAYRGRKRANAEWPYILSKVSRSEKSSRSLRRMESYKQKGNAINLPDRKKN